MTDRTVDRDPATDSSDADTRRIGAGGCSPASVEWPASCFSWWGRDARCRTARRLRSGDGGRAPDRRGDRSPRERLRGAGSVRSSGGRPRVTPRGGTARPRRQRGDAAGRRGRPDGVVSRCVVRPRRWWTTASVPLHSLGNRPSPSAPGGGGPRDDARGGLFADRRRASSTRGPGRTTPSPHPPSPRPDAGSWAVPSPLWRLPVTAIRPIVPLTPSWRRRPARDRWSGGDRDGNEDLTAATVRNSGRGTDRDADRDANRASDRRSDERSTAQEEPSDARYRRSPSLSRWFRASRTNRSRRGSRWGSAARTDGGATAEPASETNRPSAVRWTGRWRGSPPSRFSRWRSASSRNGLRCCWSALSPARTSPTRVSPRLPNPDLSVRREIDPASPADGEWVSVRTTITNEGDSALADVRVVDGPRRCSRSRTDRRDVRRRCSRVVR